MCLVNHYEPGRGADSIEDRLAKQPVRETLRGNQKDVDLVGFDGGDDLVPLDGVDELIVAARMPIFRAASIWLRMRASSGETRRVGPLPSSRSRRVAMK